MELSIVSAQSYEISFIPNKNGLQKTNNATLSRRALRPRDF
jgi:hypothetical protein